MLDVGEPSGDAARLTDAELAAKLKGVGTSAIDAAADRAHGEYLKRWAAAIEAREAERRPGGVSP